jgi:hypothetical protein
MRHISSQARDATLELNRGKRSRMYLYIPKWAVYLLLATATLSAMTNIVEGIAILIKHFSH